MAHLPDLQSIAAPIITWDPRPQLPSPKFPPDPVGQGSDPPQWANDERPRKRPRPLLNGSDDLPGPRNFDKPACYFSDVQSLPPDPRSSTPKGPLPYKKQPSSLPGVPTSTVQEPNRNILPPSSITLTGFVAHDIASITLTQIFCNDSPTPIPKACYSFPLPTGCTITEFVCRVGKDRYLQGSVKPKAEAWETFQNHIRHHDTSAALLIEDTPEIFTATLGNLPENNRVTVTLTYITVLKHHFSSTQGLTTLTIPTCIATRYGSPPKGYIGASSNEIAEGLKLAIEIVNDRDIQYIKSNSHSITVNRHLGSRNATSFNDLADIERNGKAHTATVELSTAFLDRDFVLDIKAKPSSDRRAEEAQALVEKHPSVENQHAVMLTIPSSLLNQTQTPSRDSEIIFLVDRSGSMEDKMEATKSAMQFFLKGIPEAHHFNIGSFGWGFTSWYPQSVPYTENSLKSALSYVEREFFANMGGTELLPAMKVVVESRRSILMTDIIILTDGEVWNLEQTLEYIQETRENTDGQVRFFSLGIGNAVSHALVDGIAKAGGGYSEVIPAACQGDWEDHVVTMAKAAFATHHIGPLRIQLKCRDKEGNTTELRPPKTQTSPSDISSLNPFVYNRVFLLFDSLAPSETIQSVQITVHSEAAENLIDVPVKTLENGELIHKLAARSMLHDLEHGQDDATLQAKGAVKGSWAYKTEIRRAAEAIACKWSLVSKWTSFVLVEDGQSTGEGALQRVVPPAATFGDELLRPRNGPLQTPTISMNAPGPQNNTNNPSLGVYDTMSHKDNPFMTCGGSYKLPTNPFSCIRSAACSPRNAQKVDWIIEPQNVRALVSHQRFDGSFDFGGLESPGETYLGADLATALLEISNERPDLTWPAIFTIAVLVLLWRDYGAYKSYWQLLELKALWYLNVYHNITESSETVSLVRERLESLGLPLMILRVSTIRQEEVNQGVTCPNGQS